MGAVADEVAFNGVFDLYLCNSFDRAFQLHSKSAVPVAPQQKWGARGMRAAVVCIGTHCRWIWLIR